MAITPQPSVTNAPLPGVTNPSVPVTAGPATVDSANAAVKQYALTAQQSPEETADAIASNNPQALPAVAASTHLAAVTTAVQNSAAQHPSLWSSIVGDAKGALSWVFNKMPSGVKDGLNALNAPLQEVQKDYKFIHSVWTKHGVAEGLLATLGVAGGAALGTLIDDPMLGADAALAGERALAGLLPSFKNSIQDSNNPNYLVSPGRDLSNGLSNIPGFRFLKNTNAGLGQAISGATDAAFDIKADPLVNIGKIAKNLKSGDYLDYATAADGKTLLDEVGKPIVVSTLPIATQGGKVDTFIQSLSNKAYTSDQIVDAYNNPLNTSIKRAFDDIAKRTNPVDIQRAYPASQFSDKLANDLANASTGKEVAGVMGKYLYATETTENAYKDGGPLLVLPTRTLARALVGKATDKIIQKGATDVSQERNLLLPKFVPQFDEAGNPTGTKTLWGGLYTGNAWNALANKVRTFTGYKALSLNPKQLELSGNKFTWDDPQVGVQLYNMGMYSMPRDIVLEKVADMMAEPDLAEKNNLYANFVKEVVKAAGLPDNDAIVNDVMSRAQRAATGGDLNHGVYYYDNTGTPGGTVLMKDGEYKTVAVSSHQRGGNAFIDFKTLHESVRNATKFGMLYNKADDGFSYYTDHIFAPLTLFTSGFGLRVAGSEALNEVVRNGLGSYLQNRIVATGAKYSAQKALNAAEVQRIADHVAQAITPEDEESLLTGKPVEANEVTKLINDKVSAYSDLEKEDLSKQVNKNLVPLRSRVAPLGFVASKIAPYLAKDKVDFINKSIQQNGGMYLPSGVASDHLAKKLVNTSDRVDILAQTHGHGSVAGENIGGLFANDKSYHKFWALNLSKERNEAMSKDIANDYFNLKKQPGFSSLPADQQWSQVEQLFQKRVADPKQYADIRPTMLGLSNGDPASFAHAKVSQIRGMVEGKDGTLHENLLKNIQTGERTYADQLRNIPVEKSPLMVLGKTPQFGLTRVLDSVLQYGYRRVINPIIDNVSREPIFTHYAYENYRVLKPWVDSGFLTDEDAIRIANLKATGNVIPLIHNPALRSQFAMAHRNLMPFYFAQEQALKRYGRVISNNPAAFREYQMILNSINQPGFVHTDANGQKYIVYPVVGEVGNALVRAFDALGMKQFTNLPTSVTGSTSSLLTVLPELKVPGAGPMANLALNDIAKVFPWMSSAVNVASGGYPAQGTLDTLMPNSSIRDLYQGLTMNDKEHVVANAQLSALAAAYFNGDLGKNYASLPADQQQAILDKIENNAKSNLFIKGLFSWFLPLAPTVSNDYYDSDLQSLRSEYLNMTLPKSQGGQGLDAATALNEFMAKHGTNSISYTVARTKTNAGGADVPLADSTITWLNQNKDLQSQFPNGSAYLIPQNAASADALQVENKLITMHLRGNDTPQQFLNAVYVQKGWTDLAAPYAEYQATITQARSEGNKMVAYRATQAWNNLAKDYGQQNPIWYSDYQSPDRLNNAANALSDFQKMQQAGKLTGPQGAGIQQLLTSYNDYHALLQQNTTAMGTHTPFYTQIENMWFTYLQDLEQKQPNLTNVITGVFKRVK